MEQKTIYAEKTEFAYIEALAQKQPNRRVVYGVSTCWWKDGDPVYSKPPATRLVPNGITPVSLPCDPRGGMLMECNNLRGFIEAAKNNSEKYGKHGLKAFMAAYHGNVTTESGLPTCFESWDQYNNIIDEHLDKK